jgi:putative membrane protein
MLWLFLSRIPIAANWRGFLLIVGMLFLADPLRAHGMVEAAGNAQLPEIFNGLLLTGLWLGYCIGARRVRPATGRWLAFHGASLIAALITFGPLEPWLERGSATHMIQHLLIMAVIAPLYVLAQPLPQWAAGGRPPG